MSEMRIGRLTRAAARLHAGQVDGQGAPYIDHLVAVRDAVTPRAKAAALFHDSVEDGKASYIDLRAIGLTSTDIAAVRLLTRPKHYTYDAYIARLCVADGVAGDIAREVKRADLRHNHDRLTPRLERLRPRYERAMHLLGA